MGDADLILGSTVALARPGREAKGRGCLGTKTKAGGWGEGGGNWRMRVCETSPVRELPRQTGKKSCPRAEGPVLPPRSKVSEIHLRRSWQQKRGWWGWGWRGSPTSKGRGGALDAGGDL